MPDNPALAMLLFAGVISYPFLIFYLNGKNNRKRMKNTEEVFSKITYCEKCHSRNYQIDKQVSKTTEKRPVVVRVYSPGERSDDDDKVTEITTYTAVCKSCNSVLFEKTTPFGGYNGLISDGDHDYKNIKDKELKDFIAQDLFPTSCSQILGTLFAWTIVFIFIGFVAFTYLTR